MNYIAVFWITFLVLLVIILTLAINYHLLNDQSQQTTKKPYSFARTQTAWWTLIILPSFITILFSNPGTIPVLNESTLILLGITVGTLAAARVVDLADQKNAPTSGIKLSQNDTGQNFILDILSDKDGVSIARLQALIFNFVFGYWFIYKVLTDLTFPDIGPNNLILLGMSSGTYVALKSTENKV